MYRPLAFALRAALLALPAAAQDRPGAPRDGGWHYTIAPYLFASGMNGTVDTFGTGRPAEVDASFTDLLDHLRLAGMVAGSATNGRWGVSGDLQYFDLDPSFDTPGPAFNGGTMTATQWMVSLHGEYVLADTDRARLIGLAGARWWSVDTSLSFNPGDLPGRTVEGSDSWVDPIVGLRGRYDLDDRWFVTGWGIAGGFGAGSDSMADLFGAVGYNFTERTSGVLGYRWLSVDRETDDFLYDVTMDGIMAGLTFGF